MISPGYFSQRVGAHTVWSEAEVSRIRFLRWAVLRRRVTEGESDGQMVDFRRFHHVYLPGDTPRVWTLEAVRAFESGA